MSIQATLVKTYFRKMIKRDGLAPEKLVRHLRMAFNNAPISFPTPRGIKARPVRMAGFMGDHVYSGKEDVTILYIHGGAYIAGLTKTYHPLAGYLAKQLDGEVWLTRYPFAPENPYPAAVHRCLEAYQFLLDQGRDPSRIVIMGDSAGGGLTLALLLLLKDQRLPLPACAVTLSPASTCFPDQEALLKQSATDDMLSADVINAVIELYVPDESRRTEPYASPALGDFSGLPPLQILVDRGEILYADALLVKEAAERDGVDVEMIVREGLFHVWPVFIPLVPEAKQDLRKIVRFIRGKLL